MLLPMGEDLNATPLNIFKGEDYLYMISCCPKIENSNKNCKIENPIKIIKIKCQKIRLGTAVL